MIFPDRRRIVTGQLSPGYRWLHNHYICNGRMPPAVRPSSRIGELNRPHPGFDASETGLAPIHPACSRGRAGRADGRPLEALASFMANSAGPAIAYETGPIRAVRGIPPGRPRVGNEGPANQCRCRFSKHRRRSIRCPCRLVILNQGATDPLSSPIDEDSCRVEPALRLRRS